MDMTNGIITRDANGTKRIHFRPHRKDPANFTVVKLYHHYPKDELATFIAIIGLGDGNGIIKGSHKWVFIVANETLKEISEREVHTAAVAVAAAFECEVAFTLEPQETTVETIVQASVSEFSLDIEEDKKEQMQYVHLDIS